MAKWHHRYIEEIEAVNSIKSGKYYAYDIDTLNYIMNSTRWVMSNDAYEERDYILNYFGCGFETMDGKIVYIPCPEVTTKLELEEEEKMGTNHTLDDLIY